MNRQFINESAKKGAAFLDQKISSNIRKSSINSTSSIGKDFSDVNPAFIQHLSNTKPNIDRDSLIEFIETKEGTRNKLLIESKAATILKGSLLGFLAYDNKSQTWYEFTGSHWQPLESPQQADGLLVNLIYKGTGDLGFRTAYKNGIKSLLTDGAMLPLPKADKGKLPFKNGLPLIILMDWKPGPNTGELVIRRFHNHLLFLTQINDL